MGLAQTLPALCRCLRSVGSPSLATRLTRGIEAKWTNSTFWKGEASI